MEKKSKTFQPLINADQKDQKLTTEAPMTGVPHPSRFL